MNKEWCRGATSRQEVQSEENRPNARVMLEPNISTASQKVPKAVGSWVQSPGFNGTTTIQSPKGSHLVHCQLDADEDELLLLADKMPDAIRKRIHQLSNRYLLTNLARRYVNIPGRGKPQCE